MTTVLCKEKRDKNNPSHLYKIIVSDGNLRGEAKPLVYQKGQFEIRMRQHFLKISYNQSSETKIKLKKLLFYLLWMKST